MEENINDWSGSVASKFESTAIIISCHYGDYKQVEVT
jgi:hypothetical protein